MGVEVIGIMKYLIFVFFGILDQQIRNRAKFFINSLVTAMLALHSYNMVEMERETDVPIYLSRFVLTVAVQNWRPRENNRKVILDSLNGLCISYCHFSKYF